MIEIKPEVRKVFFVENDKTIKRLIQILRKTKKKRIRKKILHRLGRISREQGKFVYVSDKWVISSAQTMSKFVDQFLTFAQSKHKGFDAEKAIAFINKLIEICKESLVDPHKKLDF